ncbi:MAG TPA: OmpA family protein [Paludibacteraceae bacterium]|nr:OmpA family protein [Paludibacteraceae bacterium]
MKRWKIIRISVLILIAISLKLPAQINSIKFGDDAYKKKQYVTAISYYEKALKNYSLDKKERDEITNKLADCYFIINNPKKAKIYYQRLVNGGYSNKKPEILLNYAYTLNKLSNYADAVKIYDLYLKKFPNDTVAICGKLSSELGLNNKTINQKWVVKNMREINSAFDDFAASYFDDAFTEIIFTSNRLGSVGKDKDNWTNGSFSDIFIAKKLEKGKWEIKSLDTKGRINTPANEGVTFYDKKNHLLYFSRCDKMGKEKNYCEIMQSQYSTNGWSIPVVVYSDSLANVGHPAISSDGLEMIFSSNRSGGFGGKDLWRVRRKSLNDAFTNPINLGPFVNTAGDEMFPSFKNDSLLYFASNGWIGFGGLDIYCTHLNKKESQPDQLPRPVNSSEDDFSICFYGSNPEKGFFTSRRQGGKGGDDIYYFEKFPAKIEVVGIIRDEVSGELLQNVPVFVTIGNDSIRLTSDDKGNFRLPESLIKQALGTLLVVKEDYFAKKQDFSIKMPDNDKDTLISLEVSLSKIPKSPIVLPDIYYDLDKWDLKPQYQDSLMILVKLLNENPNLVIEISSHTDSRASVEYNDILSQKRAEVIVDFLVSKGIEKERLIAKGYGKSRPRTLSKPITIDGYTFPAGITLTEEYILSLKDLKMREAAYQLNRRTEFTVISRNSDKNK